MQKGETPPQIPKREILRFFLSVLFAPLIRIERNEEKSFLRINNPPKPENEEEPNENLPEEEEKEETDTTSFASALKAIKRPPKSDDDHLEDPENEEKEENDNHDESFDDLSPIDGENLPEDDGTEDTDDVELENERTNRAILLALVGCLIVIIGTEAVIPDINRNLARSVEKTISNLGEGVTTAVESAGEDLLPPLFDAVRGVFSPENPLPEQEALNLISTNLSLTEINSFLNQRQRSNFQDLPDLNYKRQAVFDYLIDTGYPNLDQGRFFNANHGFVVNGDYITNVIIPYPSS